MNALDYIQTHTPRVPLFIRKVLPNGAALAITHSPLVLPTEKGTDLKDFFLSARVVHDADIKEGNYILGVWQNPGKRSWDHIRQTEGGGYISSAEVIRDHEFRVASLALSLILDLVETDKQEEVSEAIVVLQEALNNRHSVVSEAITNIVSGVLLVRAEARSALQGAREQQAAASATLEGLIQQSNQFGEKCDRIEESLHEQYESIVSSLNAAKLTTENRQIAVERAIVESHNALNEVQTEKERIKHQLGALWPIATALAIEQVDQEWSDAEVDLSSIINAGPIIHHSSPLLDRSVVMTTLLSVLTGSIGLLHGSVGVGKTHSVRCVSRRLGADFDVVPVRPSWVEPADLLGYFDPLSAIFRPGPFSEAIKKPCHAEQIRIICLDELNLARIENYGADLLSRFEYSKRDSQTYVQLYTDSDFAGLVEEYEGLATLVNDTESPEQRRRHTVLARSILKFPSRVTLPPGIALIGTLNADETTYELSPKVIDRSYCIQFPNQNLHEFGGVDYTTANLPNFDPTTFDLEPPQGAVWQSQLHRAWSNAQEEHANDITMLWDKLINSLPEAPFSDIGIPLARRFYEDFMATCALAKVLELDEREVLEFFVWTKILPRISYRPNPNKNNIARELLKSLNDLCGSEDVAWEHTRLGILDQINDPSAPVVKYFRSSR